MDEVEELCLRVLGARELAADAAQRTRAEANGDDRIAMLRAAVLECRERAGRPGGDGLIPDEETAGAGGSTGLAASVARELADSTARLPERQREALALRELLRLSYRQIAQVLGIGEEAVAPLLARARLRLRAERRGSAGEQDGPCEHRERSLRILAARQDSEPVSAQDSEFVLAHMAECRSCDTAHAAMLEASVCYRAWPRE